MSIFIKEISKLTELFALAATTEISVSIVSENGLQLDMNFAETKVAKLLINICKKVLGTKFLN
jgi:hypothetical protein